MSWLASAWAESAPVADVYERAIITIMAHRADLDGTGAFPSVKSMANYAMCDEQVIRRRLSALVERGVIGLGNQARASEIPERYRPKVYDLLIPRKWFSELQLEEVDRYRAGVGRGPYPRRPEIPQPDKARKRRSDTGQSKPPSVAAGERRKPAVAGDRHLLDGPDPGISSRSDGAGRSTEGYLVDADRGIYEIPNTVEGFNLSEVSQDESPSDLHLGREDLFAQVQDQDPLEPDSFQEQDQGQHGGDRLPALTSEQPAPFTGATVVGWWVDHYRETFDQEPTVGQKGQVGRYAGQMIKAGWRHDKIMYAAKEAAIKGYANIDEEYRQLAVRAQGRSVNGPATKPSTTNQRVNQALDLAAYYEAIESQQVV